MWQLTCEFLQISEISRLCQQLLAYQELWSKKVCYVTCYVPRKLAVCIRGILYYTKTLT